MPQSPILPNHLYEPYRRIGEAKDPLALHKALLDLGEALLTYMTGILFGEYKRHCPPEMTVEAEFYRFARQKPSFGHFLFFFRMLTGLLEHSILKEKYSRKDYAAIRNLTLEWSLLKDVVDSGAEDDFEGKVAALRKGRSVGGKGILDLFETFIAIRNIFAHPEDKAGDQDNRRKWPLGNAYFEWVNPRIESALLELIADLGPVVMEAYRPASLLHLDDLQRKVDFRIETSGNPDNVSTDLTFEEIKSLSMGLRYLIDRDNSLYIQLYHKSIPSVNPNVAKKVIEQEKARQIEPHLRQMIKDKLSDDGLIDDIEWLILRDTARTSFIGEDKLFAIIDEEIAKLGLSARAGTPDLPGDVFSSKTESSGASRFNPWWLNYFGMVPNIDRDVIVRQKNAHSEILKRIAELEAKSECYPEHERIANELKRRKELEREIRTLKSSLRAEPDVKWARIQERIQGIEREIVSSLSKQAEHESNLSSRMSEVVPKLEALRHDLDSVSKKSQWNMHRNLWRELDGYVENLLSRTLNRAATESGEWVNSPNNWQIGQLSYTYWAQIHPVKAPLGNLFHIGLAIANPFKWVPKNVEPSLKRTLQHPVALVWTSVDDKRLEKVDPERQLENKRIQLISGLIERYADRLVRSGANVIGVPRNITPGQSGDAVNHFMSVSEYLERKDLLSTGQLYSRFWTIADFYSEGRPVPGAIDAFEIELEMYLQFFANVIQQINDHALEIGIDADEVIRREERAKRFQEVMFAEFSKLHGSSEEFRPERAQMDACRDFAITNLGMSRYLFDYFLAQYRFKQNYRKQG
jgi:hypothetical protein